MSWPSLMLSDDRRRHSAGDHPPRISFKSARVAAYSRGLVARDDLPTSCGHPQSIVEAHCRPAQAVCGFM
jgi:hypothetical protein